MRDRVNDMKGRERWRPLAPIGAARLDGELWSGPRELQRYMLGAAEVTTLGRERIPGTVHVDGTARAQIATETGLVQEVLDALEAAGRDPVLINTSFNARGEPIVTTGENAIASGQAIGLDFLVVGDMLLDRV